MMMMMRSGSSKEAICTSPVNCDFIILEFEYWPLNVVAVSLHLELRSCLDNLTAPFTIKLFCQCRGEELKYWPRFQRRTSLRKEFVVLNVNVNSSYPEYTVHSFKATPSAFISLRWQLHIQSQVDLDVCTVHHTYENNWVIFPKYYFRLPS